MSYGLYVGWNEHKKNGRKIYDRQNLWYWGVKATAIMEGLLCPEAGLVTWETVCYAQLVMDSPYDMDLRIIELEKQVEELEETQYSPMYIDGEDTA